MDSLNRKLNINEVLDSEILNKIFTNPLYKNYLDQFLIDVNNGRQIDPKQIIGNLLKAACEDYNSQSEQAEVLFEIADAVEQQFAIDSLFNDKSSKVDRDEDGATVMFRKKDFYPDFDKNYKPENRLFKLESDVLLNVGMNMLIENKIEQKLKPAFSYALFLLAKN